METGLTDLYTTMITESSKAGTVDGKVKAGAGFEGAELAKKMSAESGPEGKGNKVDKPVAGPSSDTEAGKPKPLAKKEGKVKEATETKLNLSFEELYKKTLNENDDISTPEDIEGQGFDEDTGDFGGGEGDVDAEIDEEVDVASELRLLADRLSEIADKLSVDEDQLGGEPMADEGAAEGEGQEVLGADGISRESVQLQKEAIKSEPTPKPLKKTTLGPKMSQNPKNKIGKSGAGKASTPAAGKDRTGVLSPAPKTQFGPKMSQNPSGTGPAVKGAQAPLIA